MTSVNYNQNQYVSRELFSNKSNDEIRHLTRICAYKYSLNNIQFKYVKFLRYAQFIYYLLDRRM